MKRAFTALIKQTEGWYVGLCPEVPGANGQGRTREECLESLGSAIELILEVNREELLKDLPDAEEETLLVG